MKKPALVGVILEAPSGAPKAQEFGYVNPLVTPFSCDRLVVLALTSTYQEEVALEVITRDGHGSALKSQDAFALWVLLASRLAEDETLGVAERMYCKEVASTVPISLVDSESGEDEALRAEKDDMMKT